MFSFGHFFKAVSIEAFLAPQDYRDLFARRQRLQIGLGDSNMADVTEFLRIGTTFPGVRRDRGGRPAEPPAVAGPDLDVASDLRRSLLLGRRWGCA